MDRPGSLDLCMAQKANMEAIFHSVADGILTLDADLRVGHLNRSAQAMLGLSSEEAAGRAAGELLQGRLWNVEEQLRETVSGSGSGAAGRENLLTVGKDGELRVLLTTSRLFDRDGTVAGAVVVLRDVTRERELEATLDLRSRMHALVGTSHAMQELYRLIDQVASSDSTVLIQGESGTGKELVADAIHRSSPRAGRPFVKVNCSALSEGLLESELFGHAKGAFTGATHDRRGRFEMADGGTLLLDEIGDLPGRIQVKLLRVLQEREIERVGENRVRTVDVRILAATHRPLRQLVDAGQFREDLFYRLNVIPLPIVPLRDRREDIPALVSHFLEELRSVSGKSVRGVSPDALRILMDHRWPGNVRELRNAIEHAIVKSRGDELGFLDLPRELLTAVEATPGQPVGERERVLDALERSGWNRTRASRLMGIDRSTLWRRMRKLGIDPDRVGAGATATAGKRGEAE
ncbi:MAG: sigma-54-dependent Fis family transcriptional regulator [Gemmatimonadota bacterium]|nr:MAG: sigma-54-dependent Fis family transcriptional regulator [Gemmatimonadota bacterium]